MEYLDSRVAMIKVLLALEDAAIAARPNQLPGKSAVELSYLSTRIREIAMDHAMAVDLLGPDLAQNFRSLVADMREAMYLDELADSPELAADGSTVRLKFSFGPSTWLEAEPIPLASPANDAWRQSHRIRLRHIFRQGLVSA